MCEYTKKVGDKADATSVNNELSCDVHCATCDVPDTGRNGQPVLSTAKWTTSVVHLAASNKREQ